MGKRKRSKDDDFGKIFKKLKKLVKNKRRLSSSSSSEGEVEENTPNIVSFESDQERIDEIPNNDDPLSLEDQNNTLDQPDLDQDILELLGVDPTQEKSYGENLHKDLALRWKHVLTNGLPKEEKQDLLKKYLPAENCVNMKAPKLNLEIKSALPDICIKKDIYSEQKQNQMTSCLAAMGSALNIALSNKQNIPQEIIKSLSDAGRLLCDTHYRESLSRRYSIISSISKQKRDIVKSTKIDECLFGTNLSEHLKTSKAVSQSAFELRPNKPVAQPNISITTRRPALNVRGAPRIPTAAGTEPRVNPVTSRRPYLPTRDQHPPPRRETKYKTSNYQQNRKR